MPSGINLSSLLLNLSALFFLICATAEGQVRPPNYNFSLNALRVFYPGSPLQGIMKRYGKGENLGRQQDTRLMRFYVQHLRYRFSVIVQIKGDKVFDFFATLPSYFIHDVFHQSLINRFGKQNRYFQQENSAVYIWKNKKGVDFIYRATCTITCFPVYLAGRPSKKNPALSYVHQIMLLNP